MFSENIHVHKHKNVKKPVHHQDTEVHAFEPFTHQYLQPDLRLLFFFGHQVPAALLTFAWDAAVQADIAAAGGTSPTLLKPELLESIRTMS